MKGRVVEVDVCERDVGFVLSVGPVSLWLGPGTAQPLRDVFPPTTTEIHKINLTRAISPVDENYFPYRYGTGVPDRRYFSPAARAAWKKR